MSRTYRLAADRRELRALRRQDRNRRTVRQHPEMAEMAEMAEMPEPLFCDFHRFGDHEGDINCRREQ